MRSPFTYIRRLVSPGRPAPASQNTDHEAISDNAGKVKHEATLRKLTGVDYRPAPSEVPASFVDSLPPAMRTHLADMQKKEPSQSRSSGSTAGSSRNSSDGSGVSSALPSRPPVSGRPAPASQNPDHEAISGNAGKVKHEATLRKLTGVDHRPAPSEVPASFVGSLPPAMITHLAAMQKNEPLQSRFSGSTVGSSRNSSDNSFTQLYSSDGSSVPSAPPSRPPSSGRPNLDAPVLHEQETIRNNRQQALQKLTGEPSADDRSEPEHNQFEIAAVAQPLVAEIVKWTQQPPGKPREIYIPARTARQPTRQNDTEQSRERSHDRDHDGR
jgi:hypothetical protein